MVNAFKQAWDIIAKDIDSDIVETFERKVPYEGSVSGDAQPVMYYLRDPHLTAVNLQLLREIKKISYGQTTNLR